MAWTIEYDPRVERDLRGLDDPKTFGKALRHSQKGLWRYRGRDYRIICDIQQERVVVLVVAVGHRSKIYG